MISNDIDKIVEKLQEDFVKRLIKNKPDIEQLLSNKKSPLDAIGISSSNSREKVLFRSDKSKTDSSECFEMKDVGDIVQAMKYALNNSRGYDDYKSYSSCLPIALFKYNAKSIEVLNANVNCVLLRLVINCFSWLDVNDYGDRYFQGEFNVFIPLKYIFNKDICKLIIKREIDSMEIFADGEVVEDMYDIDSIERCDIAGFILDISGVDKDNLHKAVNLTDDGSNIGLKPVVSHRKDKESIAYIGETFADIDTAVVIETRQEVVGCLKVYYLLRLFGFDLSAKYFKWAVQNKYDNSYEVFKCIDDYMIYANINEEFSRIYEVFVKYRVSERKYLNDVFVWHNISNEAIDAIIEGCYNNDIVCFEAYDMYVTHVRDCLC